MKETQLIKIKIFSQIITDKNDFFYGGQKKKGQKKKK